MVRPILLAPFLWLSAAHGSGTLNKEQYRTCLRATYATSGRLRYIPMYTTFDRQPCSEDRFTDFKHIGRGAFSDVYQATYITKRDSTIDGPLTVALKYIMGPENFDQAHQEECLLANTHHPNIPQFYCAFARSNYAVLVMEYIPGVTADVFENLQSPMAGLFDSTFETTVSADLIESTESTESTEPIRLTDPIGPALHSPIEMANYVSARWHLVLSAGAAVIGFLHYHDILIRDLKAENVIVCDNKAYIIDYGAATRRDLITVWRGTPLYTAPEVIRSLLDTGHPAHFNSYAIDWYALGLTLYTMITQSMPFRDDKEVNCYNDIRKGIKHHMVPKGPPGELLLGLMSKERSERFSLHKVCQWIEQNPQFHIPPVEECNL